MNAVTRERSPSLVAMVPREPSKSTLQLAVFERPPAAVAAQRGGAASPHLKSQIQIHDVTEPGLQRELQVALSFTTRLLLLPSHLLAISLSHCWASHSSTFHGTALPSYPRNLTLMTSISLPHRPRQRREMRSTSSTPSAAPPTTPYPTTPPIHPAITRRPATPPLIPALPRTPTPRVPTPAGRSSTPSSTPLAPSVTPSSTSSQATAQASPTRAFGRLSSYSVAYPHAQV